MNTERRQVAADLWIKPGNLSHRSKQLYTGSQPVNSVHRRHLLSLSPKADTHFTIPRTVEGWVDLGGVAYWYGVPASPVDGHPSKY